MSSPNATATGVVDSSSSSTTPRKPQLSLDLSEIDEAVVTASTTTTTTTTTAPPTPTMATPIDVEVEHGGDVLLHETKTHCNGEPVVDDVIASPKDITAASDLSDLSRKIWVVTTASMPWRTGTAVNPLMRALYLTRGRAAGAVCLVIPWLANEKARKALYGEELFFKDQAEQEEWIREFCRTRANCAEEERKLKILFWEGTYQEGFGSIFPAIDICSLIPKDEADIAILEEPEHLNWFRVPATATKASTTAGAVTDDKSDADVLGWAHKFRHVVGILHTNYGAYIRQYSMGTSLLTAPALNALSSLVVRAYCHKVIRLSAALPSLDATKEVTCNVHGVRSEFLDPAVPRTEPTQEPLAPVYFIGKLIWAKGFDKVLKLQESYKASTGAYFPMDVYGGGNDEKAIRRAFFGRHGQPHSKESASPTDTIESVNAEEDKLAAAVFDCGTSLRSKLSEDSAEPADAPVPTVAAVEPVSGATSPTSDRAQSDASSTTSSEDKDESESKTEAPSAPFAVLGDLSGKALATGAETADAAMKLVESVMEAGLETFAIGKSDKNEEKKGGDSSEEKGAAGNETKPKSRTFKFVPPRSTFKWRRTPIPARFLGVKDHFIVRDIPEHKIFLNMSTTEVLCTTSAEALAMGKFLILPNHPSNEFFLQFPNCLAFKDIDDCVNKLQYALANTPESVTDKYRHMLSWEGATDRLFETSAITVVEALEREASGNNAADRKAAKFHTDSAKRSQFVSSLFSGKILPSRS